MKRYILATMTTDAQGNRAPTVPAAATSWINVHDFGNRALVKLTLPDGTAKTANTIADITMTTDEDGRQVQVDINDEALTPTQIANAKTMLSSAGLDVSRFDSDGVASRAQLLRFILRRAAKWQDLSWREVLDGWDAA